SGAIAGVMGPYFALNPQPPVLPPIPFTCLQTADRPPAALLGFWFLFQISSAGPIPRTATTTASAAVPSPAPLPGFVMGLVGVFVFKTPERDRWASVDYARWA